MKKILKIIGIVLLLVGVVLFALIAYISEDLPTGKPGPEADALAQRMMTACNADAWDDTRYVQWTFAERNTYIWDRSRSLVSVVNDEGEIIINSSTGAGVSKSTTKGEAISLSEADAAWANFCNDSFWLIAPLKAMDSGTKRELVQTDEGEGLLVHYTNGGVTPGDSYLWHLADDGLPYAMQLWTQSPPLNGIRASWTDWQQLHTGVMVATTHKISKANVAITNLASGSTLSELGITTDPFDE